VSSNWIVRKVGSLSNIESLAFVIRFAYRFSRFSCNFESTMIRDRVVIACFPLMIFQCLFCLSEQPQIKIRQEGVWPTTFRVSTAAFTANGKVKVVDIERGSLLAFGVNEIIHLSAGAKSQVRISEHPCKVSEYTKDRLDLRCVSDRGNKFRIVLFPANEDFKALVMHLNIDSTDLKIENVANGMSPLLVTYWVLDLEKFPHDHFVDAASDARGYLALGKTIEDESRIFMPVP